MAWTLLEATTRKATRPFVASIAEMPGCPNDRPMSERRISFLTSELKEGFFRPPQWATVYCKQNKKTYRVNGKHSSTVLNLANGHFPKGLPINYEHYECDTLEDVARLYSTFDRRESARLTGDINRAYAAASPALIDIRAAIINLAVSGIACAKWDLLQHRVRPDVRAAQLLEHPDFVIWLDKMLATGDGRARCRHMKRSAVVGAMFLTFQKSKAASTEFWTLVREGDGPNPSSADRRLRDYLLEHSCTGTGGGRTSGVNIREMHVCCIHGWNAWRGKSKTDLRYYPKAGIPPVK